MNYRILVINPGSTSTKIAVYDNETEIFSQNVEHSAQELGKCPKLLDQYPMRRDVILSTLEERGISLGSLSAVAARGGTFGKVEGGGYRIDEKLTADCREPLTQHPTNLAALIGYDLEQQLGIPSYIYDAVCTDETEKIASFTGVKGWKRKVNSHVLNTRAVCRKLASEVGKRYEDLNFVVAHLGGGLSLNAHRKGRIVDAISDDEGPMSPERAGVMNSVKLAQRCYSGVYAKEEMMRLLKGRGGMVSHLGTNNMQEVEERIQSGDTYALEVFQAMAYQVAKGIGSLATVLEGKVDYIILTGGVAYSDRMTELIRRRVEFLAPVKVYPGAMEMEALARGVIRILRGEEVAKTYLGREKEV